MAAEAFGENPIGIIQGRLTASGGRLQAFPVGRWKEEFSVAKEVGFDLIELIVERPLGAPNPVWDDVEGLKAAMRETGVRAVSLCDDRVMEAGLAAADGPAAAAAFDGTGSRRASRTIAGNSSPPEAISSSSPPSRKRAASR
jgi:hypothetical protein